MTTLFITIPGFGSIPGPDKLKGEFITLGSFLSALYNVFLYLAAFLAFYYLVWGAFSYLMSRGDKENLAKARGRIWWALVGLFVIILALTLAQFAAELFPPDKGPTPFK